MTQAFSIAGDDYSFVAGADLSGKQYYAVKLDTAGKVVVAGAGEAAIGILQNKPTADQAATVRTSGISLWLTASVIAPAARVAADANAKAVTATAAKVDTSDGGAAADPVIASNVVGRYLGTANSASGDLVPVLITHEGAVPTTAA